MDPRLVEMHLVQASNSLSKSATNEYSDFRKAAYYQQLVLLVQKMLEEDRRGFNTEELTQRKAILDFVFESIEYLDDSTLSLIPFEIAFCLGKALDEWCNPQGHSYIITTSLQPSISRYYFRPVRDLFGQIHELFQITFPYRLIRIGLPRYLSRDYLSNVVLYHELGHFVDKQFALSQSLSRQFKALFPAPTTPTDIKDQLLYFFPMINNNGTIDWEQLSKPGYLGWFERYLMEYFADLFAAQYIGKTSGHFLQYLSAESLDADSSTHPATRKRISLVEDFLDSKEHVIISLFQTALIERGKHEFGPDTTLSLHQRYEAVDSQDFYRLVPPQIENEQKLHGIFETGWNVWLEDIDQFLSFNDLSQPFSDQEKYKIINNLIEKAIGNYLVTTKFSEAHVPDQVPN